MKNKFQGWISVIAEKIAGAPIEHWFILGLGISILIFYLIPMFFTSDKSILQEFIYIKPRLNGIGGDHEEIVNEMSKVFLTGNPRFVVRGPYPPFAILFHMPFIFMDRRTSYILIFVLTLAAYIVSTLMLPSRIQAKREWPLVVIAIFLTGFFSYGLQFEFERGQFNLIAVCCALVSIWIFHRHLRLRWLAYLLFSAAVQLKAYPAIFIFNLIDNWRDWKAIVKRFVALGVLNFALLFLLGTNNFVRFINNFLLIAGDDVSASRNHSIGSYVGILVEKFPLIQRYSGYLIDAILMFVLFCLMLIGYQSYKNKFNDINPFFVLACTLASQLIPRISYDYTLSSLPAATAFFFTILVSIKIIKKGVVPSLLIFVICLAYGSTLFGDPYKFAAKDLIPILTPFANNFLALFVMLIMVTALSFFINAERGIESASL